MQFDNFTLVATSLAAILTLGVLSGILWLRERDAAWLSCWGLAFIVSSGGGRRLHSPQMRMRSARIVPAPI